MAEIEIIESRDSRARMTGRTDVLEKVKELALVDGKDFATTGQVAEFYEVDPQTIRQLVGYHKDEFLANGYRVVRGEELRALKQEVSEVSSPSAPSLSLWDRRAVLLLGMLLRESIVAQTVRLYLLEVEETVHEAVIQPEAFSPPVVEFDPSLLERLVTSATTAAVDTAMKHVVGLIQETRAIEPKTVEVRTVTPSLLAQHLGIPQIHEGKKLVTAHAGRDGKPWARYGNGKNCTWLDKAQVIRAYRELAAA